MILEVLPHESGKDLTVNLYANELLNHSAVLNHPIFSNKQNWYRVVAVLKHVNSNKRLAACYKTDFTSADSFQNFVKIRRNMIAGEVYELDKLMITTTTRSQVLVIYKQDIPQNPESPISISLQSGGKDNPSVVVVNLQTQYNTYAIPFVVTATFSSKIGGMSADDVQITNGTVTQVLTTQNELVYEIHVTPTITSGTVSLFIPYGRVYTIYNGPNLQSSPLSISIQPFGPLTSTISLHEIQDNTLIAQVQFNQPVVSFSQSQIDVTGGTISAIGSNGVYGFYVFILMTDSIITAKVPANSVTSSSSNQLNEESNLFSYEQVPQVGYRYYKMSVKEAWSDGVSSQTENFVSFSDIRMRWNDEVHALNNYTVTSLKSPFSGTTSSVIDGNSKETIPFLGSTETDTVWQINSQTYEDLFTIDLQQRKDVTSVYIMSTGYFENYKNPKTFKISASNDNLTWEEILSVNETTNNWTHYENYYKEFVIKTQENEVVWISNAVDFENNETNWNNASNWLPATVPTSTSMVTFYGNPYGQPDGGTNGYSEAGIRTVELPTTVTLNNLNFNSGIWSWLLYTPGGGIVTMSGDNAKISFNSPTRRNHRINTTILATDDLTIDGFTPASVILAGGIIAENKNIYIGLTNLSGNKIVDPYNTSQYENEYVGDNSILIGGNANNEISGAVYIDNSVTSIPSNVHSANCTIYWSNNKASLYKENPFATIFSKSNWAGPINFVGDGNKIYSLIDGIFSGQFSGNITNGIHFSACSLNSSASLDSVAFGPNSEIYVSNGVLTLNSALSSNIPINIGYNFLIDGYGTKYDKYTGLFISNSQNINNPIVYTGGPSISNIKSSLSQSEKEATAMCWMSFNNNNVYGDITINHNQNSAYQEELRLSGTANIFGDILNGTSTETIHGPLMLGGSPSPKLLISSPGTHVKLHGDCSATFSNVKIYNNAKLTVSGAFNSVIVVGELTGNEVLNLLGSCNGITALYTSSVFGTGTVNGNVSITGSTLCPENYDNQVAFNSWQGNPGDYYGMTINGNLTLNGTFKPQFKNNESTILKVNGNVSLGGTISYHLNNIQSGKTATVIKYTGTRTGTFSTNGLGTGATITYDDANKRVLVSKA